MARSRAKRVRAWAGLLLVPVLATVGCGGAHPPAPPGRDTTAVAAAERAVHTGECPAELPPEGIRGVGGGGGSLVPFVPDHLMLCGYALADKPGPTQPLPPVRAVVTDPATLARLRASLNGLGAPPHGPVECPNDRGAAVLEFFTGGDRIVELEESMTGCQEVGDGKRERWVGTSDVGTTVMGLMPAGYCRTVQKGGCRPVTPPSARTVYRRLPFPTYHRVPHL